MAIHQFSSIVQPLEEVPYMSKQSKGKTFVVRAKMKI